MRLKVLRRPVTEATNFLASHSIGTNNNNGLARAKSIKIKSSFLVCLLIQLGKARRN